MNITIELARKNDYREDIYIRPLYYKSQEKIGLGLIGVEEDFCVFCAPFGAYLDISKGYQGLCLFLVADLGEIRPAGSQNHRHLF